MTTEMIDGHPVVAHRVRFKGRAEVGLDRSHLVRDDMVVMWLVRTRCHPPEYHPTAKDSEERYRFNVQLVDEVMPLDGAMRESALVYMDHHEDGQSYLAFENQGITMNGELVDMAARYDVDRLAAFIGEHDVYQEEGESATDTVLRILTEVLDRVERHPALVIDDEDALPFGDPPIYVHVEDAPPEPSDGEALVAATAFDEIDAQFDSTRLGSVYAGHNRPDWMEES